VWETKIVKERWLEIGRKKQERNELLKVGKDYLWYSSGRRRREQVLWEAKIVRMNWGRLRGRSG